MAEKQAGLPCLYLGAMNLNTEPRDFTYFPNISRQHITTPEHELRMTVQTGRFRQDMSQAHRPCRLT